MSFRKLYIALLLVCAYLGFHASPLHAQIPPVQLWHISFRDQSDLNQLASAYDVWEVDQAAHTVLAPLTAAEAESLRQTHILLLAADQSPLDPPPVSASQVNGIPGNECYRTVDESFATLDQLAGDYPNLVQQVDIGDSWDKAHTGDSAGDDLRVTVFTNQATSGPKFRFFLMGAIHAREYTTSELALRFAESILHGYGNDANATWLLDYGELHLLTFANPDGRRIAETGVLWRKNTNNDPESACQFVNPPASTYGVDLNRNSSFQWNSCPGCSSAFSCSETYRGTEAGSEPEVAAIQAYLRTIYPDQRGATLDDSAPLTTPGLLLSLHSYGRLVLYPWGWTTQFAPNAYGLATLARHLGYPLNYTVCQAGGAGCLYQTDGTTDDFSYGDLGVASYTIELGTAFFQSCSYFEDTMLQPGLAALRYAFTAAPRPYQLPEGPEILDLTVTPQDIGVQSEVTISATADSSRMTPLSGFGVTSITEPTDRIAGAHVTIDELPWIGTPFQVPLAAGDGAFNTVQEAVTSTLEMACLPSGRHTLYVQAEDDQGDLGVLAAAFVTVTNSSPFTVSVKSEQAVVKIGNAVTYTVHVTNTGATTATYSIELKGNGIVGLLPSLPITLVAAASLQFTVVITPQNETAGTVVPAVIIVRSASDPALCRQLQVATTVDAWNYRQRLLIIRKD
jgi:carboxypeptidase T